jgi:predicted aconitase
MVPKQTAHRELGAVTYLVVGLDRRSLAPWHENVRAQDLATVKRVAASRAAAKGIALVVAAVIGPNSSVVQDDADQPASLSKTA